MGFVKNEAAEFCYFLGVANLLLVKISICLFVLMVPVQALEIGEPNSYSGVNQHLSMVIPLFDVQSPEALSIRLKDSDGLIQQKGIRTYVEQMNSQVVISIVSRRYMTEPRFSFIMDIFDERGNLTSKSFSVELPKQLFVQDRETRNQFQLTAANKKTPQIEGVMGPYDWAQAGQVASQFGPVLDGQSLWRVARRINKALDVSISQMMWALYQNNPNKFTAESIEALRAGSFLTIPTQAEVASVSDFQARRLLANLADDNNAEKVQAQKDIALLPDFNEPIIDPTTFYDNEAANNEELSNQNQVLRSETRQSNVQDDINIDQSTLIVDSPSNDIDLEQPWYVSFKWWLIAIVLAVVAVIVGKQIKGKSVSSHMKRQAGFDPSTVGDPDLVDLVNVYTNRVKPGTVSST